MVPPGMDVEVDGMALCGGFEDKTDAPLRRNPDVPTLRVRGLALLGGVGVEVRLPGETPRQAKRRRRLEEGGSSRDSCLGRTAEGNESHLGRFAPN